MPAQGGWGVRGEKSMRLTVKTETKNEALKIATNIAKDQQSELTILGRTAKLKTKTALEMILFHTTIKNNQLCYILAILLDKI